MVIAPASRFQNNGGKIFEESFYAVAAFNEYLDRRDADLTEIHPQWDFSHAKMANCTNDESKRDLTPICIPQNLHADGIVDNFKNDAQRIGDEGETEFLEIMQSLPIGGILIGNIDQIEMRNGNKLFQSNDFCRLPGEFTDDWGSKS
jgi:hypothetical protein